ncbi:MAG: hypothetical protein QGG40_13110 [Myxococcota bacterium]|nr:hypothetical protein [Myxococcota bacterium]
MRAPSLLVVSSIVLHLACGSGDAEPDASWDVTVTGVTTDCQEILCDDDQDNDGDGYTDGEDPDCVDPQGYQEDLVYDLFFDGSETILKIDGNTFATGLLSGCSLSYASSVWLEERDGYDMQWQIEGSADIQLGGGCNIDDGYDWYGTETIEVLGSDHPEVLEGCTYEMDVAGLFLADEDE